MIPKIKIKNKTLMLSLCSLLILTAFLPQFVYANNPTGQIVKDAVNTVAAAPWYELNIRFNLKDLGWWLVSRPVIWGGAFLASQPEDKLRCKYELCRDWLVIVTAAYGLLKYKVAYNKQLVIRKLLTDAITRKCSTKGCGCGNNALCTTKQTELTNLRDRCNNTTFLITPDRALRDAINTYIHTANPTNRNQVIKLAGSKFTL